MNKGIRNSIIVLVILMAGYFFISSKQSSLVTQSSSIFDGNTELISKVLIQSSNDAIELSKLGDSWEISGNDTLVILQNRIDNLLNTVLSVNRETMVSQNPEKWDKYSVDDSSGTHLALLDAEDNTIGYFVFGRSMSDYSHNYIRLQGDDNVYLTDSNVIHHLSTVVTFWGEVPKIDEPETINPSDSIKIPVNTGLAPADQIKLDTSGAVIELDNE